ncbi:AP-3 complex subunit delta [Exaiptasia diaphana]|nr:AP-3 complex subunit delta [Exaiptasia diaphana]
MNLYDAGIALSGFSCFVSPDLARDLANDVMSLLVSTKPYIRKRAVLLMYKIFLKFPEALRPAFPRLREKLEDSDPERFSQRSPEFPTCLKIDYDFPLSQQSQGCLHIRF